MQSRTEEMRFDSSRIKRFPFLGSRPAVDLNRSPTQRVLEDVFLVLKLRHREADRLFPCNAEGMEPHDIAPSSFVACTGTASLSFDTYSDFN
jgi:hypothetical protein